jgi:hypothetical protein
MLNKKINKKIVIIKQINYWPINKINIKTIKTIHI